MLRNFYPTTRFCPIFCWFLRYLSPLKRSMLSKYFAINIYSFKLSIFGTALDIIMFKKCIFPPFFLHLLPMKKKLRYTNGGRQTQICRLLNRQIRHCQLDQNSLAVLYIVHVVWRFPSYSIFQLLLSIFFSKYLLTLYSFTLKKLRK